MGPKPKSFKKGNAMSNDCCSKGYIVDAECIYDGGRFIMGSLPGCLPTLFTARFRAPADYVAGNVVVVKGKELPVRTPGMVAATSDIFKAGAVIHCDIDLDRELAFFWQGGGNGVAPVVLPNMSYEEQFAGYYDEEGKKVYFKTVQYGAMPTTSSTAIARAHNILNIDRIVHFNFIAQRTNSEKTTYASIYSAHANTSFNVWASNHSIMCNAVGTWAEQNLTVYLYYTCTDR